MNCCHFRYKHIEKGSESDTFMFDVTNGIQSLHGLEFVIEIIPKLIPLEIRDFAVMEGDHKLLTGIKVTNSSVALFSNVRLFIPPTNINFASTCII